MPVIASVARPLTHEVEKVRGSRFVVDVAPATSEAEALAVVDAVRQREPDASHHCWAYVLASGRARASDDGEPGGSAGEPIRRHIGGSGLVDVVVVVTRWFGGTKLGVGGLVRAYGGAAAEGLALADVVERRVVRVLEVRHPYDLTGAVEAVLAAGDAEVREADYGADVVLHVAVPVEEVDAFTAAVREATAGAVTPT